MADPQGDPRDQHEEQQRARPTAEIMPPGADEFAEAARSLGELAVNGDMTITQERSLFGDLITAQPVKVARNDAKILQKIDVWAAMAGERWYYRYPVKNRRKGTTDWIEGPSVKCTNAIGRLYGNCSIESRTMRLDAKRDICYSRFGDLETGFSITKGQIVPRSATLGGEDEERRQQIAHNVGQSKSQRNVIDAALGDFTQRAFQAAKKSILERIGRNIDKARERIVELLNDLGREHGIVGVVPRVEYVKGRTVAEWLAPDIAGIHGELNNIEDGFASIDETWPLPAPPEPRRGDIETPAAAPTSPPTPSPNGVGVAAGAAAASSPPADHGGGAPPPTNPPADEPTHHPHAEPETPPPSGSVNETTDQPGRGERDWTIPPGTMGQDNVIKALHDLLDQTVSDAEQDDFEQQNAERIAKITGEKGRLLRTRFADKRRLRAEEGHG